MTEETNRIDVKEYLKQVKLCDIHINSMLEEKAQLESLALRVTSTWGGERVSGSGNLDKLGDTVAKLTDLERKIDSEIDRFIDKKDEVKAVIEQVKDPKHLKVLLDVYIHFKTLETVASEMGYTYRNTCYLHGRALQAVEEVLKDKTFQ